MKKIMKRAWEIVKNAIVKFGGKCREYMAEALRMAWAEAKTATEKKHFEKEARIVIAGREHYDDDQASKFTYFKLWEKGGKRRIYVNDYKRRTYGYIDLDNGCNYVEVDHNNVIEETVTRFVNEYEIA